MSEELYARIHPDAKRGQTPVKYYDTAGVAFQRGQGPYKGWHPVTPAQVKRLQLVHVTPGNPNSMRIFQVEKKAVVDEIAAAEARMRMTPEQQRMDLARDSEVSKLRKQVDELSALAPLIKLLANPALLQQLQMIDALNQASSGAPVDPKVGDRVETIAAAPPRRPPMDERMLDDAKDVKPAPQTQPPARQQERPAQAPPARPGAAKKDEKKGDKKGDQKKPDVPPPARPGAAPTQPPVSPEAAAILAQSDEEDDA